MKKALFILTLIIVGGLTFSCSTDEYDVTQETSARKMNDTTADMMRTATDSTTALPAVNIPNMNTEPIATNPNLDTGDNGGGTLNPPKR